MYKNAKEDVEEEMDLLNIIRTLKDLRMFMKASLIDDKQTAIPPQNQPSLKDLINEELSNSKKEQTEETLNNRDELAESCKYKGDTLNYLISKYFPIPLDIIEEQKKELDYLD